MMLRLLRPRLQRSSRGIGLPKEVKGNGRTGPMVRRPSIFLLCMYLATEWTCYMRRLLTAISPEKNTPRAKWKRGRIGKKRAENRVCLAVPPGRGLLLSRSVRYTVRAQPGGLFAPMGGRGGCYLLSWRRRQSLPSLSHPPPFFTLHSSYIAAKNTSVEGGPPRGGGSKHERGVKRGSLDSTPKRRPAASCCGRAGEKARVSIVRYMGGRRRRGGKAQSTHLLVGGKGEGRGGP